MNSDYTQQQSLGGLQRSEKLSLQSTTPPAEIPGYRIEKLLGQGAFGEVWQGFDLNTGRPVAVKFYLHRSGVDWSLLRREVKHLVNMSTGRYIVQVLGVGWEAEPPYYVMEHSRRYGPRAGFALHLRNRQDAPRDCRRSQFRAQQRGVALRFEAGQHPVGSRLAASIGRFWSEPDVG